ncbi:CSC1-like protein 1 [Porphyridium purpureum]|uniref:CSC1-like protein 1 n=1 Tax=Porphyridium purpureum TaxID=35688 RepID=A0A5J4YQQ6_PORPP|nr:CSC1-like protein 1 [Porphyridium purpureum]|eukprot:POR0875..scf296_7
MVRAATAAVATDNGAAAAAVTAAADAMRVALVRTGNTYKQLYEATSMRSGLVLLVLVNVLTVLLGACVFRYLIFRDAMLSEEQRQTVQARAAAGAAQDNAPHLYTPAKHGAPRPPPEQYRGRRSLWQRLTAHGLRGGEGNHQLGFDAQVYLRFQKLCILLVFVAGMYASCVLIPANVFVSYKHENSSGYSSQTNVSRHAPGMRGFLEHTTAQSLNKHAWQLYLVIPFWLMVSLLVAYLYRAVAVSTWKEISLKDWILFSRLKNDHTWTVMIRRLPVFAQRDGALGAALEEAFPGSVLDTRIAYSHMAALQEIDDELWRVEERHAFLLEKQKQQQAEQKDESLPSTSVPPEISQSRSRTPRETLHNYMQEHAIRLCERRVTELLERRSALEKSNHPQPLAFATFNDWRPPKQMIEQNSNGGEYGDRPRHSSFPLASLWREPWLLPSAAFETCASFFRRGTIHRRDESSGKFNSAPRRSLYSQLMECAVISNAPQAQDIIWQNLMLPTVHRLLREFVVELCVAFVLVLFSSPVSMIAGAKQVVNEAGRLSGNNSTDSNVTRHEPFLAANGNEASAVADALISLLPKFVLQYQYLREFLLVYTPVFLLTLVNSLAPSVLRFAASLEGYMLKSVLELSVFRKTVFYVVLNSVLLPALAMDTASEFVTAVYKQSNDFVDVRHALPLIERVFSGGAAFFLCNYLVQLAGTGNLMQLMRLPAYFSMLLRTQQAVTSAERAEAKCNEPFDYPYNYAQTIAVMCMCLLFGGLVPIIWLFALPYFITKHIVDTFNIAFVHPINEGGEDGGIHRDAATFLVFFCLVSELLFAGSLLWRGFLRSAGLMTGMAGVLLVYWLVTRLRSKNDNLDDLSELLESARSVSYYESLDACGSDAQAAAQGGVKISHAWSARTTHAPNAISRPSSFGSASLALCLPAPTDTLDESNIRHAHSQANGSVARRLEFGNHWRTSAEHDPT